MAHLVSGRLEQCYISASTFNVLFFLLFAYFFCPFIPAVVTEHKLVFIINRRKCRAIFEHLTIVKLRVTY